MTTKNGTDLTTISELYLHNMISVYILFNHEKYDQTEASIYKITAALNPRESKMLPTVIGLKLQRSSCAGVSPYTLLHRDLRLTS